jgi:hypothetical protein
MKVNQNLVKDTGVLVKKLYFQWGISTPARTELRRRSDGTGHLGSKGLSRNEIVIAELEAERAEILDMLLEICLPLNINQLCAIALVLAWLVRRMRERRARGKAGRNDRVSSFESSRRGYRLSKATC